MILAGDIGGTNTRLALFEMEDKWPRVIVEQTFPSREHKSLDEIVRQFLGEHGLTIKRACFGVAGPIRNRRSKPSNLPWIVDADQLATLFGFDAVTLVNDLEANAFGLVALEAKDFAVLNEGAPESEGNTAIISAGTGLGEAGLHFEGKMRRPFAREGGHSDFAPRNELEIELLRYRIPRFHHISYERVLSGPGLLNIYTFLRDTGRGEEAAWLADEMQEAAPPAAAQPREFERLFRAAADRKISGTGLRLSIIKVVVDRWGGRVWLESEEGAGARFSFPIPPSGDAR